MTTNNTIFEETVPTVRISQKEYEQLLEYKAICKDILVKFGGDGE